MVAIPSWYFPWSIYMWTSWIREVT